MMRLQSVTKHQAHQQLLALSQAGTIELRPEGGLNRLSPEDRGLSVPNEFDKSAPLSWLRILSTTAEEMPRGSGGVQSQIAARMQPPVVEATPKIETTPEVCSTCIPWIKVSRDPAQHAAIAELAKKFGKIKTPRDIYAIVGDDLNRETQEVFLVIALNVHARLMCAPYEIARGQRDRVAVGIDNVMDAASDARCSAFLVCHQHPGDSPEPSEADWKLFKDIVKATPPGRVCIDSLVVTPGAIYSCAEKKLYKIKGG
jgi:hypothetical protein